MPLIFILDSSVFIAFYVEMENPELLHDLKEHGHKVLAPHAVVEEISKKDKSYLPFRKGIDEKKVELLEPLGNKVTIFQHRHPYLGKGEIEVILWGQEFQKRKQEYCCIIDDKRATKIAESYSIDHIGTLGLLRLLNGWGLISDGKMFNLVERLDGSSFRMRKPNHKYK